MYTIWLEKYFSAMINRFDVPFLPSSFVLLFSIFISIYFCLLLNEYVIQTFLVDLVLKNCFLISFPRKLPKMYLHGVKEKNFVT